MDTRFAISPDSTRIAFDVSGGGTPILLLHGGGSSRREWHEVGYVSHLQDEFMVIPIDLRGHGESDKPTDPASYSTEKLGQDILAVADTCELDRFILCGFSFGGNVSRYLAARSDRVSRLVMLGNRLGSGVSNEFRQSIAEFQVRWADVVSHAASPFDPMSLSAKDKENIQQLSFSGELLPSVLAWSAAMLDWSTVSPQDICCPALWLVGSEDGGAMESYHQCEQGIPHSKVQVHILDGMNHEQVFDYMEQILPLILSFIKRGTMDHVVYLDAQARELENLLSGSKTMIIRGATGRKLPHGRVDAGDMLYFINNNAEGKVRAKAKVKSAFHSEKMTEDESRALVKKNQPKLSLNEKQIQRWAGKRYIVLIEVSDVKEIPPFTIDRSKYGNMDDWLPVVKIETVRK